MPFISNPTLALGLNGVTDGSAQLPFLDLMKQARPWKRDGTDLPHDELVAGNDLELRISRETIVFPPGV